MPPLVLATVLASALLHASWNMLLARVPRGSDTTAVALALGLLAWTPVALSRWRVDSGVWPYVWASAALELVYFGALNFAYARVPAHAAYPVARGLAPVFLLPIAAASGGRLPVWAGVGVAAISAGVLLTSWGEADRRAVGYAVPVAVCIAAYTIIDSRGLHHADPATYLWLTMIPVAAVLLMVRVVAGRGTGALRAQLRPWTLAMGVGIFGAYGLVLAALAMVSVTQVPAVAAVRESSIVFVIALSWLPTSRARPTMATALGAVLVFAGVAALAIT